MKKLLRLTLICAAVVFIIMLLVVKDLGFLELLILSLLMGLGLAAMIHDALYGKKKGLKNGHKNSVSPRPTYPKPIYIRKPFENGCVYRVEYRHGKQFVFEGYSNKYIYRIEGEKIYRGMDNKICYWIRGNKVYNTLNKDNPIYRIENDKIYQGNLGRRPVYEISRKPVR